MLRIIGRLGIIAKLQNRKYGHAVLQVCVAHLKYCVLFWRCYLQKEHGGMEEYFTKEKNC